MWSRSLLLTKHFCLQMLIPKIPWNIHGIFGEREHGLKLWDPVLKRLPIFTLLPLNFFCFYDKMHKNCFDYSAVGSAI